MNLRWPGPKGWLVAAVLAVLVVVVPVFLEHGEEHEAWWSSIPAWWAIFGLGVGALILLVSALSGRMFLQQGEDFYGEIPGKGGKSQEGGR